MSHPHQPAILMLSRDATWGALMQKALEEAGFQVFGSARGDSAVALLLQLAPRLLLMDWNLSEISPLALTRLLRADARFARLPIVLAGRALTSENKILALEAGVDLCLDGDVTARELTARVRAILRRADLTENHAGLSN